jgi:peptide/nickel transport system substrate-binding protein
VEWVADQYVKLEKFGDYWNPRENPVATEGQSTVPGIDEVYFVIIPDNDAQFLALQAGNIDAMATTVDQYFQAADDPTLDTWVYDTIVYDYLCFNLDPEKTPLFQDVRVRKAIAYAINRDVLIDQVLRGLGSVCNADSHPLRWDWDDVYNDLHPDYDVEKTIELMEEAGWTIEKDDDGSIPRGAMWTKDGEIFEFEIATNHPNQRRQDIIQVLQQQLFDAGFSVVLRILDTNAFYYDYLMGSYKFETAVAGWKIGSDPDGTSVWTCDAYPDAFNWLYYCNPEVDRLMEAALQLVEPAKRKPLYVEANKFLIADQPYVWLNFQQTTFAAREQFGLKGFLPVNPNGWYVNLWQWEVEG